MEIKFSGLEKIVNHLLEWLKRLPCREVVIGPYQTNNLSVNIRVKIILSTQPNVEIFLDRIEICRPYCPKCYRPLDYWDADFIENDMHIGYNCNQCKTEYEGDMNKLLDDVKGEIRKKYQEYWSQYNREIRKCIFSYLLLIVPALVFAGISCFTLYPMLLRLFSQGKWLELVGGILFFIVVSIVITLILWPFWGKKKENKNISNNT